MEDSTEISTAAIEEFNYVGRKKLLFPMLMNLFPPHKNFYELMCGSAYVSLNKKLCKDSTFINDIDPKVMIKHRENNYAPDSFNREEISFDDENIYWLNVPAGQLIASMMHSKKNLLFLDPPYPMDSRRAKAKLYKFEMSDKDHLNLLSLIRDISSYCVVCTYPNTLYGLILEDWNYRDYQVNTHGGMTTERIYFNFKPNIALFDYDRFGENFTDRQRIKRKTENLISKIDNSAPLEKCKMIEEFYKKFGRFYDMDTLPELILDLP